MTGRATWKPKGLAWAGVSLCATLFLLASGGDVSRAESSMGQVSGSQRAMPARSSPPRLLMGPPAPPRRSSDAGVKHAVPAPAASTQAAGGLRPSGNPVQEGSSGPGRGARPLVGPPVPPALLRDRPVAAAPGVRARPLVGPPAPILRVLSPSRSLRSASQQTTRSAPSTATDPPVQGTRPLATRSTRLTASDSPAPAAGPERARGVRTARARRFPRVAPEDLTAPEDRMAPSPTLAAGTMRVHPKTGMQLVWVPPGEFSMGSVAGGPAEQPIHRVRISRGFWLSRTEVTCAQYGAFLDANPNYPRPRFWQDHRLNAPGQPVVGIQWPDATAFAQWLGGWLPSEAEWEYAARGPEGLSYPWGAGPPRPEVAVFGLDRQRGRPEAVGVRADGASWCGAQDLSGNVWEWCADWYARYRPGPGRDPRGPAHGQLAVVRGGGWATGVAALRAAERRAVHPETRDPEIGFRIAMPHEALVAQLASRTQQAAVPAAPPKTPAAELAAAPDSAVPLQGVVRPAEQTVLPNRGVAQEGASRAAAQNGLSDRVELPRAAQPVPYPASVTAADAAAPVRPRWRNRFRSRQSSPADAAGDSRRGSHGVETRDGAAAGGSRALPAQTPVAVSRTAGGALSRLQSRSADQPEGRHPVEPAASDLAPIAPAGASPEAAMGGNRLEATAAVPVVP